MFTVDGNIIVRNVVGRASVATTSTSMIVRSAAGVGFVPITDKDILVRNVKEWVSVATTSTDTLVKNVREMAFVSITDVSVVAVFVESYKSLSLPSMTIPTLHRLRMNQIEKGILKLSR